MISDISSDIWFALAGIRTSRIPEVNSDVYYFPQGHSDLPFMPPPQILCNVLAVRFLCSSASDNVFVKFLLARMVNPAQRNRQQFQENRQQLQENDDDQNDENSDLASFSKVLTPSDANNGGGFSVPRFCADTIFPPLNYDADPPVQKLHMRDVTDGDVVWEFRHIYRGTPRRHLLTTGWSKFVNGKRLVAGGSVVFMRRKSTRELFIGVRRGKMKWTDDDRNIEVANGVTGFEVVYFPKSGVPEFVVNADRVDRSMANEWRTGMRVKLLEEEVRSSGIIQYVRPFMETRSAWKMLEVIWDDPKFSGNADNVSPWQVEPEQLHSFPPLKRLKDQMLFNGHGDSGQQSGMPFSPKVRSNFMTKWIMPGSSGMLNYETPPFSMNMQGIRPTPPPFPSSLGENFQQSFTELLNTGLQHELDPNSAISAGISTLNLGNISNTDNLPPPSQSSASNSFGSSPADPNSPAHLRSSTPSDLIPPQVHNFFGTTPSTLNSSVPPSVPEVQDAVQSENLQPENSFQLFGSSPADPNSPAHLHSSTPSDLIPPLHDFFGSTPSTNSSVAPSIEVQDAVQSENLQPESSFQLFGKTIPMEKDNVDDEKK